jgi:sugar/nucleoside kinase (ribokinase family)
LGAGFLGAGIQGWLRRTGEDGRIEPAPLAEVPKDETPLPFDVAIVSEEDHPDAEGAARRLARTVAITRGARGARLIAPTESLEIPAAPAREVDPTGAGDVFGVVLTLELAQGRPLAVAGRAAAAAAARVVERSGLGTLCRAGG